MPHRLQIDPDHCIGCRSCELACALENHRVMAPQRSRISVVSFLDDRLHGLPYHLPTTCHQCADAPCRRACPEEAILRKVARGVNRVVIDSERCTGCGTCIGGCPFGAIYFDADAQTAIKCELCDGQPACAAICPSGAIRYETMQPYFAREPTLKAEAHQILRKRNTGAVPQPERREHEC